jgi:hypothetical protein
MSRDHKAQEEPKYRQLLRPIGVELDRISARNVLVFETDQALVWQAFARGDLTQPEYGVVGLDDLPLLLGKKEEARSVPTGIGRLLGLRARRTEESVSDKPLSKHPLVPEGYEEFFRSLGLRLDTERASQVMICEADDSITVEYQIFLPLYVRADPLLLERAIRYKEIEFRRPEIRALIAGALGHRRNRYFK